MLWGDKEFMQVSPLLVRLPTKIVASLPPAVQALYLQGINSFVSGLLANGKIDKKQASDWFVAARETESAYMGHWVTNPEDLVSLSSNGYLRNLLAHAHTIVRSAIPPGVYAQSIPNTATDLAENGEMTSAMNVVLQSNH